MGADVVDEAAGEGVGVRERLDPGGLESRGLPDGDALVVPVEAHQRVAPVEENRVQHGK